LPISSPVLGLRPGRWFLRRRSKLPKPDSFTCRPPCSASRSTSKNASTNSFASRLFRPTSSNRRSAISALVSAMSLVPVSAADPRAVVVAQCGDHARDHGIGVLVRESARVVLQNQAHSQTLEAGFHARALVAVEQLQVAQDLAGGLADAGGQLRPG